MGKVLYILTIAIAVGVGLVWNYCNKEAAPLVVPSEDVWWGPANVKKDDTIRPFSIKVPDEVITDLNHRLDNTRLAPPLEGINFQYGFNTDTLNKVIAHWRKEYKWKDRETYLNQFPQYKTQVQGLDIHYIHVKPKLNNGAKKIVPLLMLHGWPGSVREFYSIIPKLTEKPEHGADFVFEVIVPSLPGYGFSSPAVKPGLGPAQMAVIFQQLMSRLGHDKFYIQGGDWGSQVASHMGAYYPKRVLGLHLNMCTAMNMKIRLIVALGSLYPSLIVEKEHEHELYPYGEKFGEMLLESGYLHIQATKPDTVGVGLTDSPAGLAAYILEKFSTATNREYRAAKDGGLTEKYTYTELLDNVMIYWITGSMTSAMRLYAENFTKEHRGLGLDNAVVPVPTWCSKFHTELGWLPDWILRSRYPKLMRTVFHEFGGHFAAFENPKTLADDVWQAFIEGQRLALKEKINAAKTS